MATTVAGLADRVCLLSPRLPCTHIYEHTHTDTCLHVVVCNAVASGGPAVAGHVGRVLALPLHCVAVLALTRPCLALVRLLPAGLLLALSTHNTRGLGAVACCLLSALRGQLLAGLLDREV